MYLCTCQARSLGKFCSQRTTTVKVLGYDTLLVLEQDRFILFCRLLRERRAQRAAAAAEVRAEAEAAALARALLALVEQEDAAAATGQANAAPEVVSEATPASKGAAERISALTQLSALLKEGALTEDQYDKLKTELLVR